MMEKLTRFADYFRKIPAAFLVAIISVLALILFLPEDVSKSLAVYEFREKYKVFLGPVFLLAVSFCIARVSIFFMSGYTERKNLKKRQELLHQLTPEEKGYLIRYIENQKNTIYVGDDDGVMGGLQAKRITYCARNMGSLLHGFAYNLQPWARSYLEEHPELLEGYVGRPMTPDEKLFSGY